jgi:hypothetical protein
VTAAHPNLNPAVHQLWRTLAWLPSLASLYVEAVDSTLPPQWMQRLLLPNREKGWPSYAFQQLSRLSYLKSWNSTEIRRLTRVSARFSLPHPDGSFLSSFPQLSEVHLDCREVSHLLPSEEDAAALPLLQARSLHFHRDWRVLGLVQLFDGLMPRLGQFTQLAALSLDYKRFEGISWQQLTQLQRLSRLPSLCFFTINQRAFTPTQLDQLLTLL